MELPQATLPSFWALPHVMTMMILSMATIHKTLAVKLLTALKLVIQNQTHQVRYMKRCFDLSLSLSLSLISSVDNTQIKLGHSSLFNSVAWQFLEGSKWITYQKAMPAVKYSQPCGTLFLYISCLLQMDQVL
jgi:hypothetical protein